jgi:hypothetical protein
MDIRKILKKIGETKTPPVNKVAVAYSGGGLRGQEEGEGS